MGAPTVGMNGIAVDRVYTSGEASAHWPLSCKINEVRCYIPSCSIECARDAYFVAIVLNKINVTQSVVILKTPFTVGTPYSFATVVRGSSRSCR